MAAIIDDLLTTDNRGKFDSVAWGDAAWEHCSAGLCLIDAAGLMVRTNSVFTQCLGYADDALVGTSLFRLFSVENHQAMQALHESIVTGRLESKWLSEDAVFVHFTGRPVVSYSRNRRIEREGTVKRLITVFELSQLGRTAGLAEQVHRAKNFSALAGVIANDLNNLLSIVLGYTALLHDPKVEKSRIRVAADGVDGAVNRASSLVRQTLYLARRPDPVTKIVDFPRFVEHTLGSLRSAISNRPVETDLSLSRLLNAVHVDPGQMTDALAELFGLIKAAEPSAAWPIRVVTRVVEGSEVRERFSTAEDSSYAMLEIVHPAQPCSASASPFSATASGNESKSGLNLGLTMVERILDGHRGFLGRELLTGGGLVFFGLFAVVPGIGS
jgi:PAS domain S-box-containing protein